MKKNVLLYQELKRISWLLIPFYIFIAQINDHKFSNPFFFNVTKYIVEIRDMIVIPSL